MNYRSHAPGARLRYVGALVLLAAVWLAMLVFGRGTLDQQIYRGLYAGDRPLIAGAAHVFTALGEPTVLIAASVAFAVWLWFDGRRVLPFVIIAITMLGRGLSEVQKYWVGRPRPELEPHLVVVKTMSFPSGHANSSMIFYLVFALVLTEGSRWRHAAVAGALLLSFLVGLSRVMLGVHWPSDVIGGWAFGALWVLLTLRLAERYIKDQPASGGD
jgi:undecaprenyl-diphosphatase